MKKFYTMVAQQNIERSYYGDEQGKLYPKCQKQVHMPLIVTLINEVKENENFTVLAMDSFQNPASQHNYELLKEELEEHFPGRYTLEHINAPVEINMEGQIALFKKLYRTFEADDEVYFDITFGYKLIPMTILVACNYAKKFVDGMRVRKLMYAVYDFTKKEDPTYVHRILDVTSIFYLNDFIDKLAQFDTQDPTVLIDQIFAIPDSEA